jgi:DNA helicase-2/ATP-dependent DNA helicase PcrA
MTIQREEREQEIRHLKNVTDQMRQRIRELRELVEDRKGRVVAIRRDFWDEISLNADNPDDLIETAASVRSQVGVLQEQERTYKHAYETLRRLEKSVDSPYFGRIDFREEGDGSGPAERIYIGLASFVDPETDEILVYDWRAPISGMFYDYPPGPAQYNVPDGETIRGEITLKRQYIIRGGRLIDLFDTGLHIGDEMLQRMLGRSADDKMKSIVTTIQSEQNRIIRDDRHQVVIVQGAAGSGKTSVALQRVAYLLYKYRNTLSSDNMVLFSPNDLFNDYISNVLPELGEANMRQTTFLDHLERRLGQSWTVEDAYSQLETLLNADDTDPDYKTRAEGIAFKSSLAYMELLERYSVYLQQEGMRFTDFRIGEKTVIPAEQIRERFYTVKTDSPLPARIDRLTDWLVEELDEQRREAAKRYYRHLLKQTNYVGTDQEMKDMSRKKAIKHYGPLIRKAKQREYLDLTGMYIRLLQDEQVPGYIYTIKQLDQGRVPYEDAAPLSYLKSLIEGMPTYNAIRHVIIDEAQDYSPFQFAYIKKLFPRARFTLLGDWNQGIYTHALAAGYRSIAELFHEEDAQTYRLVKSYRSTQEIVDMTKAILPQKEPVEPFSRSGEKPQLLEAASEAELPAQVLRDIRSLKSRGAGTVAVICKTQEEAQTAFERLQEEAEGQLSLQLINKETPAFTSDVTVIPAYLAKGLEFDAVIVYNASKDRYSREKERKLFYTACTRAMHFLHLHYTGGLTPFLSAETKTFR